MDNLKYIQIYYPPLHRDYSPRMTDTECVAYSLIYSYIKQEFPALIKNKKLRYKMGYKFNINIFRCLGLNDRQMFRVLANLDNDGHIKRHNLQKHNQCEVSLLTLPKKNEKGRWILHRDELGDGNMKELLIIAYSRWLFDKYKCLDYDRFINCKYWGKNKLIEMIRNSGLPRYLIGGKVYYIEQKVVDKLDGTDYNQELYDAVSGLDPSQVYEINWAIKKLDIDVSPIGILQILNKMGHVKPDTGGGNDGLHVRRRAG